MIPIQVPVSPIVGDEKPADPRPTGSSHEGLGPALTLAVLVLSGIALAGLLLPGLTRPITTVFFQADARWLTIAIIVYLVLAVLPGVRLAAAVIEHFSKHVALVTILLATGTLLVGLIGSAVVLHGYALSRDEAMAVFDATIFAHGHLVAPVAPSYRPYADALEPLFMLPVRDNAAWISSYLPGNAAIRATFDLIASPGLASPAMAALAVAALAGVARQLWPERPDAAVIAIVLLASSSQVLVTAMTPYAMSAHLALNLVWLWLFLIDRRWSHVAAILVGVLATGLHQLVFHPLFAMPFVTALWLQKRVRLAAFYSLGYGLIGVGWIFYWQILLHSNGLEGAPLAQGGAFLGRAWDMLRAFDPNSGELMLRNLARFLAWQNPILLPLMIAAGFYWRTMPGTVVAAWCGFAATLLLVFLLMPFQGHGWGYRYAHGLIGSCALVAAHGWVSLTRDAARSVRLKIATQVGIATIVAVLIILPFRAGEAGRFTAPFAAAEDLIVHADSPVVFVDPDKMLYATDLVRNDPFLRSKPLIFDLWAMTDEQVRTLCAESDVSVFDETTGRSLGFFLLPDRYVGPNHRALMRAIGCGRPIRRKAAP